MGHSTTISLAGRVAVTVEGHPSPPADLGPLARVAFAYLVLERHRPVSRDELAEALWGEGLPPTWRSALRGVVSRLRAFLNAAGLRGSGVVSNVAGCYQLRLPGSVIVDAEEMSDVLAEARSALDIGDPAEARHLAARAVQLCQSQFLAGARGNWVEHHQDLQADVHVQALELLADAAASEGDHRAALRASEQAVAMRPWRESAHQRVIAAHARSGNRGEALRAHERCRRTLMEELGVPPSPATEAVCAELLQEAPTPVEVRPRNPSNLPHAATSFVGRQWLVSEVARLLTSRRLLSLLGTSGVGKSRVALEVGRVVTPRYPGGVWLVELADLKNSSLLALEVLSALGLPEAPGRRPEETLARELCGTEMLILLDNCEHVAAACADLAGHLLRACPRLTILTTSREPLGAAGETTLAVPPMPTPRPDPVSVDELVASDAARLFVERALDAVPRLEVASVADAVATICRGLDGIPLAIELAAARVRTLAIPELAQRLDDRLRLLVGGPRAGPRRHQTMRDAIHWSHEGLTIPEQTVFAELSVFAGGFTLAAAEDVCESPNSEGVLEALSALVDKSLVEAHHAPGTVRYRLLETLRQYATDRLRAAGTTPAARERHLAWMASLARSAEAALDGPDQARWLAVLEAEHDNVRAALEWAAESDRTTGLQVALSIWRYFEVHGHLSEGRQWLEMFASGDSVPARLRADGLHAAGVLAQRQRDQAGSRRLLQASHEIFEELDDHRGMAVALHGLANVEVGEGHLVAAQAHFQEILATARSLDDRSMLAASLLNLGVVTHLGRDAEKADRLDQARKARGLYTESLAIFQELGDRKGVALALENLGVVAGHLGDPGGARDLLEQSLAIRRHLGDRIGIAAAKRFLGQLAFRGGQLEAARSLHQESLAIERELGNRLLVADDLVALAGVAEAEGKVADAGALLQESLAVYSELGDAAATQRVVSKLRHTLAAT